HRRELLGGSVPSLLRPLRLRVLRGAEGNARQPCRTERKRVARPGAGAEGAARALRQPVAYAVPLRDGAPSGADRRGGLLRLSFPRRVPPAASKTQSPEVPRRARD